MKGLLFLVVVLYLGQAYGEDTVDLAYGGSYNKGSSYGSSYQKMGPPGPPGPAGPPGTPGQPGNPNE